MGNTIFLDTDILVDLLRNKREIIEWIKDNERNYEFAISTISLFELYSGAFKSLDYENKIEDIEELTEKSKIFSFLKKHSSEAGKQRAILEKNGNVIDMRDILIGSTALAEGFPIKTNNKNHFERIKGLKVI